METYDRHGVRITIPTQGQDVHWARGCNKCKFGLVSKPDQHAALSLYSERAAQASLGLITFCDCRAGKAYHAFLRNAYKSMREEMDMAALRKKVDVECAAPPIRYVPAPKAGEYLAPPKDEDELELVIAKGV